MFSSNPVKVLVITPTFPPYKDGVSEAAAIMTTGFIDYGWCVEVATAPFMPPREEMQWKGAKLYEFTISGNGTTKNPFRGQLENYRTFLKQGAWDVVVFHGHSWTLYVPIDILAKISGNKILVSHGFNALQWIRVKTFPWGLYVWLNSAFRAFQMFFWIKKFDRTVYLSDRKDFGGFIDHWIARTVGHPGMRVIPNGVNLNVMGENPSGFRQELEISENHFLFLYVANYSRRKDQGFAVRAFRAANLPNAVMIFIGSEFNSDSAWFQAEDEALPSHLKRGRIIWLEKISRNKTLDAFAACDVFVLSADHEAQPIALLEAMREGKPWLSRDVGCISDMPGGICVRSEAEMTDGMVRLATTPRLRKTLGDQGRVSVEKLYNSTNYVSAYCDLVTELAYHTEME